MTTYRFDTLQIVKLCRLFNANDKEVCTVLEHFNRCMDTDEGFNNIPHGTTIYVDDEWKIRVKNGNITVLIVNFDQVDESYKWKTMQVI